MKKIISKEWCESEYYCYKGKLEDLLTITFIGMFIIFFFIIILGGNYKEALLYAGMAYGCPFAIVRVMGLYISYSFSFFGIIWLIIQIIFITLLSDLITLFSFIHYACQTSYYYRQLKKLLVNENIEE